MPNFQNRPRPPGRLTPSGLLAPLLLLVFFPLLLLSACAKRAPDRAAGSEPALTARSASQSIPKGSASIPAGSKREVVFLAGGCFWGMEEILRAVPGVLETEVGYAGGSSRSPGYDEVKTGATGHAETVKVVFDPQRLSLESLLTDWFFRMHDPTTKDRQGNDVGSQYRSAIFTTNPNQRDVAVSVIQRLNQQNAWGAPLVTQVGVAGPFTRAEDDHQDYLQKHPGGYTCHYLRDLQL